jgi:hypothetical protein
MIERYSWLATIIQKLSTIQQLFHPYNELTQKIEHLFVLKSCYMGHQIMRKNIKSLVLDKIDVAIKQCETLDDYENKLNLLFYALLKCEILRETDQIATSREYAKKIADDLDEHIFGYYMNIQEITQQFVKRGGISHRENDTYTAYSSAEKFCLATGLTIQRPNSLIYDCKLKEVEKSFLFKTTLTEMMMQHETKT